MPTRNINNNLTVFGDGAEMFLKSADHNVARIIPRGTGSNLDKGLLSLFDTGTEDVRIDTAGNSWFNGGNIGIGQGSPTAKLHLKGDGGSSGLTFKTTDFSNNEIFYVMDGGRVGVRYSPFLIGIPSTTSPATNAVFQVEEAGLLTVLSTGKVGIGTTSPSQKLHVEGNTPVIQIRETSGTAEAGISMNHSVSGNHYNWFLGTLDGSPRKLTIGATVTDGHSTNTAQAAASLMLFDQSTGNVGIGTTNPTSKLHIEENGGRVRIGSPTTSYGGIGFAGSLTAANAALWGTATKTNIGAVGSGSIEMKLGNDAGGNGSLKMEADKLYYTGGNLGIGTTSPDHGLHVKGDVTIDNESSTEPSMLHFNALNKTNHDPTARINFWEGDGHAGAYTGSHAYIEYNGSSAGGGDGYLAIGGNTNAGANTDIMVLNRLGNVGIGTTNPIANLHVNGDVQIGNSNNPNSFGALQVNQASNVDEAGIGVLSASAGRSIRIWVDETRSYINSGNGGSGILVLNEGVGNVGIGILAPTFKLHVKSDDANDDIAYIHHDNPSQTSGTVLKVRSDAGNSSGYSLLDVSNGTSTKMLIDGAGNTTFSGNIIATEGLFGATGSAAPDRRIWSVSTTFNNWGIFYNEGSPDAIEFKAGGSVTAKIQLDDGKIYAEGSNRVFHDGYHPNADTLTTTRNIALTGDVTGNVNFNGSSNVSITTAVANDSHTHDGRYYTETESANHFKSLVVQGNFMNTYSWSGDTVGSASNGWSAFGSTAPFSGNNSYTQNGTDAENSRSVETLPNGAKGVVWQTPSNDSESGADGGWNCTINGVDSSKAYRSVIYFRRTDDSTSGTFYHGCSGSHTLNTDGTVNTNPYFKSASYSSFVQDRWYVSIGYIQPYQASGTTNSVRGGIYDCTTGKKVSASTDFMMKNGSTTQQHRTYLYYSTDTSTSIDFYGPRFEEVNGNEPSTQELVNKGLDGLAAMSFHSKYDPEALSQLTESSDANDDKLLLWDKSASEWKYMRLDDLQDSIDNNTTYSAGTGLTLSGTTFSLTDTASKLNLSGGTMTGHLNLGDSIRVKLGQSQDLQLVHDGSNSYIHNVGVGHLYLRQTADNKNIILESDNGSGGSTAYLTINGSTERIENLKNVFHYDNVRAQFGDGADLQIYHDGSHSYIDDIGTGNLNIRNGTKTSIWCESDGTVRLYYNNSTRLQTTTDGIQLYGNGYLDMPDNGRIRLGASYDLAMYHDGSNSYIQDTGTGNFNLQSNSLRLLGADASAMLVAHQGGAVNLYHNGSSKFATTSSGIYVAGNIQLIDSSSTGDGRITFGDNEDLQIYHDGSHSYIRDGGAGELILSGGQYVQIKYDSTTAGGLYVRDGDNALQGYLYADGGSTPSFGLLTGAGQWGVRTVKNGLVELRHNNVVKLQTTSGGVTVTGQLSATTASLNNGVGNGSGAELNLNGSGDIKTNTGGSLFFGAYNYGTSTYIRGHDSATGLQFFADGSNMMNISSSLVTIDHLTVSGVTTLSGNSNHYAGHHFFDAYDSSGNHYPHYLHGTASSAKVNIRVYNAGGGSYDLLYIAAGSNDMTWRGNKIWNAGNDGSGSGLDADLLDGNHASAFATLASPTFTGAPKAPTPSLSDNNTNIATTEYVKGQGYVTTDTNTTYSAGSGLTLSGTEFSHSDTSSQSSSANSGRTYIQSINLDGQGHVTGLSTATETVTNTDTNTTYSAGRGLDLSGTEFQLETDLRDSISHIGYDSGDYIQWSNNSYFRSVVNGSERFRVNSSGIDVNGTVIGSGFQTDTTNTAYNLITRNSTSTTLYVQAAQSNSLQTIASFRYGSATANGGTETFRIRKNDVNVFGANFTVGGSITGNSKNFSIPHPTKEGKRLVHSCLEGPEIGVYFRGRSTSATIEMPDYWAGLVHLDSMTVELTAIGPNQDLYVGDIADDGDVTVASNTETPLNYFYVVYGERKDLERLEVEIDDTVEVEESLDNSEESEEI